MEGKRMKRKLLTGGLCFCLLVANLLSGCKSSDNNLTQPDTSKAAVITKEPDLLDYLPERAYDATFEMLVRLQDVDANYTVSKEGDKTEIDSAVFSAYSRVSDRFGISFHFTGLDGYSSGQTQFINTILSDIQAGGNYDAVAPSYYFGVPLVIQGCYLDLNRLPVLDFSNPWWYSGFNDTMELQGAIYTCAGAFDTGHLKNTYALAFNESMVNQYSLSNPYELYQNNEWTFDRMLSMAEEVGNISETGTVGLAITRKSADCFFQASGLRFVDKDSDGALKVTKYSDRAEALYQTLSRYIGKSSEACKYGGRPDIEFPEGKTLFSAITIGNLVNFKNVEFQYGVMVYPKYHSEQKGYFSTTAGSSVFALTKVTRDPEKSAVILEALNACFYDQVTPAIFRTVLQGRISKKPEMAAMLEVIRDSVYYDFGFVWNASLGNIANFTSFIEAGSYEAMSTWYDAVEGGYKKKLSEFLTLYAKIPEKISGNH